MCPQLMTLSLSLSDTKQARTGGFSKSFDFESWNSVCIVEIMKKIKHVHISARTTCEDQLRMRIEVLCCITSACDGFQRKQ